VTATNGADGVDPANGYEAAAPELVRRREASSFGVATVRAWATALPRVGPVLDLGCGSGAPIAEALSSEGFEICGLDSSPTLAAAFRRRLPRARLACESVEESLLVERRFDGVIAVGVLRDAGLALLREHDDEGGNHYYDTRLSRTGPARREQQKR